MAAAVAHSFQPDGVNGTGSAFPGSGLFLYELDETMRRLRGSRLRLSLCRLDFPLGQEAALDLAATVEDPALITGFDACGRLLILYVGPRPDGPRGDALAFTTIMSKLRKAFDRRGEGWRPAGGRIATLHTWADTLSDSTSLLRELDLMPVIPLAAVLRAAA